ncbi:hypothetical protein FH5_04323 [Priestia endophytica]|nr:hypothetical protein FH5_04323 [Priestia endophytica]
MFYKGDDANLASSLFLVIFSKEKQCKLHFLQKERIIVKRYDNGEV